MNIKEKVKSRILELIFTGQSITSNVDWESNDIDRVLYECSGWIGAAMHIIHVISGEKNSQYMRRALQIEVKGHGSKTYDSACELIELLKHLSSDLESGLLTST